jgi:hypothetical protein
MSPEPEASPPMSELERVTGVFFNASKTFADLSRRPRWLVPLLLVVLATVAYIFVVSQQVGWERIVRRSMETNARVQSLTTEQREQAIERGAKFGAIIGYAGAVLGAPISLALIAAVLLLTSRMMGAQLTYRQLFAISSYAGLTSLVFIGLSAVVLFLVSPDDYNIQNPVASNLGAYLDPQSTPKAIYSLAVSMDLFTFWRIALLAIGISAASSRALSFGKGLAAVALPWGLMVVVKMGWAAMFG